MSENKPVSVYEWNSSSNLKHITDKESAASLPKGRAFSSIGRPSGIIQTPGPVFAPCARARRLSAARKCMSAIRTAPLRVAPRHNHRNLERLPACRINHSDGPAEDYGALQNAKRLTRGRAQRGGYDQPHPPQHPALSPTPHHNLRKHHHCKNRAGRAMPVMDIAVLGPTTRTVSALSMLLLCTIKLAIVITNIRYRKSSIRWISFSCSVRSFT